MLFFSSHSTFKNSHSMCKTSMGFQKNTSPGLCLRNQNFQNLIIEVYSFPILSTKSHIFIYNKLRTFLYIELQLCQVSPIFEKLVWTLWTHISQQPNLVLFFVFFQRKWVFIFRLETSCYDTFGNSCANWPTATTKFTVQNNPSFLGISGHIPPLAIFTT